MNLLSLDGLAVINFNRSLVKGDWVIRETLIRLHEIVIMRVVEGFHVSTEEISDNGCIRRLDLIEIEVHIPILEFL